MLVLRGQSWMRCPNLHPMDSCEVTSNTRTMIMPAMNALESTALKLLSVKWLATKTSRWIGRHVHTTNLVYLPHKSRKHVIVPWLKSSALTWMLVLASSKHRIWSTCFNVNLLFSLAIMLDLTCLETVWLCFRDGFGISIRGYNCIPWTGKLETDMGLFWNTAWCITPCLTRTGSGVLIYNLKSRTNTLYTSDVDLSYDV